MKALCWNGIRDVRVENVPDPKILNPRDAIVRITTTAICGSDLHLYDGYIPTMQKGDILGHEFMGEVVDVGNGVKNLALGDRVVVPFTIACGDCFFCEKTLFSCCDNSNPNAALAETGQRPFDRRRSSATRTSTAATREARPNTPASRSPTSGRSRSPTASRTSRSSSSPTSSPPATWPPRTATSTPATSWPSGDAGRSGSSPSGAPSCSAPIASSPSTTIPSGSGWRREGKAEVLNYEEVDVFEALREMTGGRGPDSCIDAVGMESHGHTLDALYDRAKAAVGMTTDRIHALRQAI